MCAPLACRPPRRPICLLPLSGPKRTVGGDGSAVGVLPRAKEPVVYARTTTIQADRSKIADGIAKFGAIRTVPGVNGIECLELGNASIVSQAEEVETS